MAFQHIDPRVDPALASHLSRRQLLRFGAVAGVGLAASPLLAACGPEAGPKPVASGSPPARPTGVLRVAGNAEPVSLSPVIATGVSDLGVLLNNVYEALFRYKPGTSELEGVLADRFESSADAREWKVYLKPNIKFHDGEPLTSSAVRTSFEFTKSSAAPLGFFLPANATYDDSDPAVLRVTTAAPYPDFARFLTLLSVMSPKIVKAGQDAIVRTPTGTGPYKFVSYETAQRIVLEANTAYRGPGPYLERIEVPIIPDAAARVTALRSGSVDLVLRVAPQDSTSLRGASSLVVRQESSWANARLEWFTNTAPMDNVKLRQAIAHAIDRPALVKAILGGVGGKVDDSWVATGMYGYAPPKTTNYDLNVNLAKSLLAESGLTTPVELTIGWSPDEGAQFGQLAEAIAGMLKPVGINVTVKSLPLPAKNKIVRAPAGTAREWHGTVGGTRFISGAASHLIVQNFFRNELQVTDPTLNQLTDRVVVVPDGSERTQIFADIENRVAELALISPLYGEVTLHAHKNTVQGFTPPNDGLLPNFGPVYLSA
ncbi:ABC transporter substrate-binding protein [Dactylosporangium roseum]|uniref:ABC transporter substrate-binding protein n=1 Tax=Dactylosporangium roseum TaxID=47989 RepID=A0ABY5YYK7_9ACTN|nr:ABC transporter substrate-binding protein [Dactylosporangium roseum]UWZ34823.1 ABC transporter substrate-binding protein [Dactylosporangium roseum]